MIRGIVDCIGQILVVLLLMLGSQWENFYEMVKRDKK